MKTNSPSYQAENSGNVAAFKHCNYQFKFGATPTGNRSRDISRKMRSKVDLYLQTDRTDAPDQLQ